MGNPRFEPLSKRSKKAENNRGYVLAYLAQKGSRTGEQLRDDLAARCGSRDAAGKALTELHRTGKIELDPPNSRNGLWKLAKVDS